MSNMLDYLLYRTPMRKIARDDSDERYEDSPAATLSEPSGAYRADDVSKMLSSYEPRYNDAMAELERLKARDARNMEIAHKMYRDYLLHIDWQQKELDKLRGSSPDIPQKSLGGRVASGMASVGNAVSKAAVPTGRGVNQAVENAERIGRNVLRSTRKAGRKSLDWLRGR